MKRKNEGAVKGGDLPMQATVDAQPLLRALAAQAHHRGDTLHKLAKVLGVTYARLTQWRRHEPDFANAHVQVIERAAHYLGIPTILGLVMAGRIGLADMYWPAKGGLGERVEGELERLRRDPFIGSFVPQELASASPAVQLFVVFLFHELAGPDTRRESMRWLGALHQVAAGDLNARMDLERLRESAGARKGLF